MVLIEDKLSGPYFSITYDSTLKGIQVLVLNVEEEDKEKALKDAFDYLKNKYNDIELKNECILFGDTLTDEQRFSCIDDLTDYKPFTEVLEESVNKVEEDSAQSITWEDLSGADQTAAGMALDIIRNEGEDIESAVRRGCNEVADANAYDEYEGEEFYMEEPDYDKVLAYVQQKLTLTEVDECTNPSSIPNIPGEHKNLNWKYKEDIDDRLELDENTTYRVMPCEWGFELPETIKTKIKDTLRKYLGNTREMRDTYRNIIDDRLMNIYGNYDSDMDYELNTILKPYVKALATESLQLREDAWEDGPCGSAWGNAGMNMWRDEETGEYYSNDYLDNLFASDFRGMDGFPWGSGVDEWEDEWDEEEPLNEDWTEIKPREHKTDTSYRYMFWRDKTGGLSFECDKDGNVYVDELNPTARKNYEYAMSHPEDYIAQGVEEYSYNYVEPALVKCSKCGVEFTADPDGWGEVECPECGQLYNGFGQELARRGTEVDWWDAGEEIYPDDDYYYESLQLKEDWINELDDYELDKVLGGEPTVCPECGTDLEYDRGNWICPFCEGDLDGSVGSLDWQEAYNAYYEDLQLKEAVEEDGVQDTEQEYDNTFGDASDIPLTGDVDKDFETVVNYLRSQDYSELGEALDEIVKDPKLYELLSKGFGEGDLAKVKMSSGTTTIAASQLLPSQSEIGLDNSLAYPLKSDCHSYFKDAVTIVAPIITYRKTFIIDGHHRWSQALMINPNVKMNAINFNYEEESPYRALRNFQGAIAVTNRDVPSQESKVNNVYEMSEDQIREYVENNIQDVCVESLVDVGVAKDKQGVIDYIVNNAMQLKSNNPPFANAPDREYMPQTDDASIQTAAEGQTNI